ncbi:MAG: leucine-rich repeat protein [Bacilli bacterium]|nr:leucine-rich repeat protein [Bacilli bacterium]
MAKIGADAFSYCSSLESIVIPNSVKIVGYYVFNLCDCVTIYCETPYKPSS